jgi:DNA end-binding protein Ku
MWSGSINFGLVNIPVKLYTAVRSANLKFNFLRKNDLCPIGYTKVCRKTGEEVPSDEIVRGYQYQKGDFIVLDEEDFKKADVEKTYSITIEEFVDEKQIDHMYYDRPYYVEPEKAAAHTYALFREAMAASKKAGIGKFVLKDREHLVMLKAHSNIIVLNILRFQREIVDPSELNIPGKAKIPKNQLDLALELINKLEAPFKPEKYHDDYTEKLKKVIEAKTKGKKIPVKAAKAPKRTATPDIVNRLKESLAMAGK